MSQEKNKQSHFFAYLARMKFIDRWSLMRNTWPENVQEHSLQVAMIAHALALIGNKKFERSVDPEKIACQALFHDVSEVITGDLVTPIKYFNPEIRNAYDSIEQAAEEKLLSLVPEEFLEEYRALFKAKEDPEAKKYIKAADRICAYLKCVEELRAGNDEFRAAKRSIQEQIEKLELEEAQYFMEVFVPSFSLSMDEL